MAIDYLASHGLTRINKRYVANTANRTAIWTPATSARIILTDVTVSSANAGTVRVEFGTSNGFVIFDHVIQGSVMLYPMVDGAVDSLAPDCPLVVSFLAGTVQSNEATYLNVAGYEDRT